MSIRLAFRIEHGIPLPRENRGGPRGPKRRHRRVVFPWTEMQPGDSFFAPKALRSSVAVSASNAGKKLGLKFTVRRVEGGIRAWRVE